MTDECRKAFEELRQGLRDAHDLIAKTPVEKMCMSAYHKLADDLVVKYGGESTRPLPDFSDIDATSSKTVDPWAMVPKNFCRLDRAERKLKVHDDGEWTITTGAYILASGYNCDPSRNGETRVWVEDECQECRGYGGVTYAYDDHSSDVQAIVTAHEPCPTCQGTGKIGRWQSREEDK